MLADSQHAAAVPGVLKGIIDGVAGLLLVEEERRAERYQGSCKTERQVTYPAGSPSFLDRYHRPTRGLFIRLSVIASGNGNQSQKAGHTIEGIKQRDTVVIHSFWLPRRRQTGQNRDRRSIFSRDSKRELPKKVREAILNDSSKEADIPCAITTLCVRREGRSGAPAAQG